MADWFLWFKAGHIISVVAWMAGLFYLPRLLVYHSRFKPGAETYELFLVMERRLSVAIMRPAGVSSWVFGVLCIVSGGYFPGMPLWLHAKIGLVILMTLFHAWLDVLRAAFVEGRNSRPERFFRIINELPTLLLVGIVILVVVRPFG